MKSPVSSPFPVTWPVGLSFIVSGLALGVTVIAAVCVVALLENPAGQSWRIVLLLGTLALALASLWCHWRAQIRGFLRFDGERWWFRFLAPRGHVFDEQVVTLKCVWAVPGHLWLRLEWGFVPNTERLSAMYVWASMNQDSYQWIMLLRALVFDEHHRKKPVEV